MYSDLFNQITVPYTNHSIYHKINSFVPIKIWGNIRFQILSFLCIFGLFLEIGFSIQKINSEKINKVLCWTILLLTSCVKLSQVYLIHILSTQLFCCIYLIWTFKINEKTKKIKKKPLKKPDNKTTSNEFSDLSDFEDISSSSRNSSENSTKTQITTTDNDVFNNSFATNSSFVTTKSNFEPPKMIYNDLNKSLNDLHLGGLKTLNRTSPFSSPKRPKPILSPPKLQNINQNSWLAGGFWRDLDGVVAPQRTNLSRSSSESSGFGSQQNGNQSKNNSICGDFDKFSRFGGSQFQPISPQLIHDYTFTPVVPVVSNNTFYPNLNQNNMLFIQGSRSYVGSPDYLSAGNSFVRLHNSQFDLRGNQGSYQMCSLKTWPDHHSPTFRDLSLQSNL